MLRANNYGPAVLELCKHQFHDFGTVRFLQEQLVAKEIFSPGKTNDSMDEGRLV